ncbi:MAG: DUF2721 domain-containing protein [Cytophagales bacterium]|jgi:hypothetical protein|nr:DUF2721 domain-containing protein [Cytophagales bacterium]
MEQLSLNVPAFIFPTVSLLMLAYTNRFLAIANLIRNLHSKYQDNHDATLLQQIGNLRLRLNLIRNMQAIGVLSLFLSVASMFFIFEKQMQWATGTFVASLVALMVSLGISVAEIYQSTKALNIQLRDIEENLPPEFGIDLAERMRLKRRKS